MTWLNQDKFTEGLQHLKQAQTILEQEGSSLEVLRLLAITFNNLSCLYKKQGKLKVALSYIKEVLLLELRTNNDVSNLGGTHLNICAILSQLGEHERALKHAKKAVVYFSKLPDDSINIVTMKIVAFHNVGAELEHLSQFDEWAQIYEYGHELSNQYLGDKGQMTVALKKSLDDVQRKLQAQHKTYSSERLMRRLGRGNLRSDLRNINVKRVPGSVSRFSNRTTSPLRRNNRRLPPVRTQDIRVPFRSKSPGIRTETPSIKSHVPLTRRKYADLIEMGSAGTRRFKDPYTKLKHYL